MSLVAALLLPFVAALLGGFAGVLLAFHVISTRLAPGLFSLSRLFSEQSSDTPGREESGNRFHLGGDNTTHDDGPDNT